MVMMDTSFGESEGFLFLFLVISCIYKAGTYLYRDNLE